MAADGSSLHIATNPHDSETYFEQGFNLLHLNAMYDLCSRIYVDAVIQPGKFKNEHTALVEMVARSHIEDPVIVIADRGYESYNNFARMEHKGWKYLIRVKDIGSSGILSAIPLPSDKEFDVCVQRILTRKQTKEVKAQPERYRYISNNSSFDFLDWHTNKFYPMSFRVVRFQITEDTYETVITNLDSTEFSPQELKELYKMRWGIETSFKELKYAVGLTHFHSKKMACIAQEVFARIIMYNFAEMITSHVVISQANTKFSYQVNFTIAIHICRHFLRLWSNTPQPNVEALIRKNILPVRPGRKDKRKIRSQTAVSFLYRVA